MQPFLCQKWHQLLGPAIGSIENSQRLIIMTDLYYIMILTFDQWRKYKAMHTHTTTHHSSTRGHKKLISPWPYHHQQQLVCSRFPNRTKSSSWLNSLVCLWCKKIYKSSQLRYTQNETDCKFKNEAWIRTSYLTWTRITLKVTTIKYWGRKHQSHQTLAHLPVWKMPRATIPPLVFCIVTILLPGAEDQDNQSQWPKWRCMCAGL